MNGSKFIDYALFGKIYYNGMEVYRTVFNEIFILFFNNNFLYIKHRKTFRVKLYVYCKTNISMNEHYLEFFNKNNNNTFLKKFWIYIL